VQGHVDLAGTGDDSRHGHHPRHRLPPAVTDLTGSCPPTLLPDLRPAPSARLSASRRPAWRSPRGERHRRLRPPAGEHGWPDSRSGRGRLALGPAAPNLHRWRDFGVARRRSQSGSGRRRARAGRARAPRRRDQAAGRHRLRWDGRDAARRPAAAASGSSSRAIREAVRRGSCACAGGGRGGATGSVRYRVQSDPGGRTGP
jgi:hypothetical protein